ncbi:unnamed protein product [Taenia asiatica]|uniref:Transmembrane protein n=1 Tax=Taenia asiatica TaxID=60517 RepID=A0A158R8M3_TAEAS|nr:unnamed protein product [Taenia asiatica]
MAELSGDGDVSDLQYAMEPGAYNTIILTSFLIWAFIHHVASPLIFSRNVAYRALNKYKRMEWDSRVVSTLHATSVSVLCVVALVKESQLWADPFLWFYRKVGYTLDRRRVAIVSLIFSIFFAITRNFMIIPYWSFMYSLYGTPKHIAARERLPNLDVPMFVCSLVLDALNIYWALMVYPIGYKAAYMLYRADWRTDFDRARNRIRGRFLSARRRAMNTELIASLRRSASFNLIQRAWEEWSLFPEDFSETELFTMSVSERSSPLRRYSDSDDSSNNKETEADLFYTGVHGSSSFVAAVTVVSRQLMYDASSNTKAQTVYRYGSVFYLILIALLQIFRAIPSITLLYSFFGLLYGWTYLRFFQKHTDGKRGDFRGSFSFVRRIALQDLNARLGKKQEPLEEWPTLFDEEGNGSRSPNPATAPPHSPPAAPDNTETKAVQQSTDSLPNV